MGEEVITLIKKLLISLVIISTLGATSIVATRALLSDHAVLSANTFSTGTADLLIGKGQSGSFADTQTGFTSNLLPGEIITNYLRLKNNSSEVDFTIAAQASNVGGNISPNDVTVTYTPVNSSEVAVGASVSHSLADWSTTPASLGTPNIADGDTQEYQMDVSLSSSVSSTGTATFDFMFTGTQTP